MIKLQYSFSTTPFLHQNTNQWTCIQSDPPMLQSPLLSNANLVVMVWDNNIAELKFSDCIALSTYFELDR